MAEREELSCDVRALRGEVEEVRVGGGVLGEGAVQAPARCGGADICFARIQRSSD